MIKVYFNHIPGNIHPVYQEMLYNKPEGIEYINKNDFGNEYQKTAINMNKNSILNKIKNFIFEIIKKYYFLPNINFRKLPGDIVFSSSKICLFNDYILDLEAYEALNRFSNKLSNNFINKLIVKLLLSRNNCKKITFWSDNAKKGFQSYFGNIFDYKTEVLYPAIKLNHNIDDILSWKNNYNINILFVGRYFERKGGGLLLESFFKIIEKQDNIYLNIISNVDEQIKQKYKHNNINFLGLLSRENVIEYFKKSDIYLMPTFQDTFGMVFLEAFSYGSIPISIDTFAINNIIDDGIDGYIIKYNNRFHNSNYQYIDEYNSNIDSLLTKVNNEEKNDIINKIVDKLDFLINNRELRNKFIINGFKKVENGKFCIQIRNNKIKSLFK